MVSPRKRPTAVHDHHHGLNESKGQKAKRQHVFAKRKFFLDLKNFGSNSVKELAKDLILLGGTIESFFSKEVTVVITDAPEWKLRLPGKAAAGHLALTGTTFAPSPSTSVGTPGIGANNSPNWSPLSVQEDGVNKQKFQAKSRVETILEKAKQQNATQNQSCDVIENAQKLNITIWCLSKIIVWIDNYKRRYGPFVSNSDKKGQKRSHSASDPSHNIDHRDLKAPYIKFEVTNHEFRPVFSEFRRFPKLYFGGRAGQSPFFMPDRQVQKLHREYPPRKQNTEYKIRPPQPQNGYCEICECPFSELEEHLGSKVHTAKVGLDHLWSKLDTCINAVNAVSSTSEDEISQCCNSSYQ